MPDKRTDPENPQPQNESITKSFLENEGNLKRFLRRFFYDTDEVDDMVQSTFLRAYQAEKKQEIQSPKSYLFKIARNVALKELTKRSRQIIDYIEGFTPDEVLSSEVSVEDEVNLDQKLTVFDHAVATLPPQCKKAFLLRKVYGLSHKEISQRMEISVSTVEKHIANGLQRCSSYMNNKNVESLWNLSETSQPSIQVKSRDSAE